MAKLLIDEFWRGVPSGAPPGGRSLSDARLRRAVRVGKELLRVPVGIAAIRHQGRRWEVVGEELAGPDTPVEALMRSLQDLAGDQACFDQRWRRSMPSAFVDFAASRAWASVACVPIPPGPGGDRAVLLFTDRKKRRWSKGTHEALCVLAGGVLADGVLADGIAESEGHRAAPGPDARAILEHVIVTAPVAMMAVAIPSGIVTLWNPACERMFGWTAADVLGKPNPTVPPEKRHEAERLADPDSHAEGFRGLELTRRTKGGRPIEISLWNTFLRDERGTVVGSLGYVLDVTQRNQQEAKERGRLRESATRIEAASAKRMAGVLENITDVFYAVDADWNFTYANHNATRFFGRARERLLGRHLWQTFPEAVDTIFYRSFQKAMLEQRAVSFEAESVLSAGTFVAVNAYPSDNGLAIFSQDITEQRQALSTLEHTREQLRRSQKLEALGRLAGGIAHDFNNILTVIAGHTGILIDDADTNQVAVSDLRQIQHAADRATNLTRQLLTFSRRRLGQPQPTDLDAAIRAMEPALASLAGEHVELTTSLRSSAGRVLIDPGETEQILVNLVLNARDAMPQGGGLSISTRCVQEPLPSAEGTATSVASIALAIRDHGTGMEAATVERIFEPFFTSNGRDESVGLGLATVHGITKQCGGTIAVESVVGEGTTITITLPETAAPKQPRLQRIESDAHQLTVLVVDDDPGVLRVTSRILSSAGHHVLKASRPSEAIQLTQLHHGDIDVILSDVVMPEMGGGALVNRLKVLVPTSTIVFMSGYAEGEVAKRGVISGETSFLEKPFTPDELISTIRQAANSSAPAAYRGTKD